MTFRVVGHDQVPAADESLTHTMCLEMTDALFAAPLDAAEKTYGATEDAYPQEGKTYYKLNIRDYTYTEMVAGTDYKFGLLLGAAFEKNIGVRDQLGYSRFSQSNLLQWLNSTEESGAWFDKKNIWDSCSQILMLKAGFCYKLDAEFLAAVSPARITTALPEADGGGSETTDARFWILSYSQINGTQTNGVTENERLEWYQAGNDPAKILMNGSAIDMCWLRSIYSTEDTRNRVIPLTRPYTYSANPVPGVVPVCIIA